MPNGHVVVVRMDVHQARRLAAAAVRTNEWDLLEQITEQLRELGDPAPLDQYVENSLLHSFLRQAADVRERWLAYVKEARP